jgi:hypothetical protein
MAGFIPAIHVFFACGEKVQTWMPGTRPGMTKTKEVCGRIEDQIAGVN